MYGLSAALVVLHVVANLVWIGSILAVAFVLSSQIATPLQRGELGRELYNKLAVPAFLTSFSAGLLRLVLNLDLYFVQTKYMHGKLFFAVLVIALHHVVGARAKGMASGKRDNGGPVLTLAVLLLLFAAGAAFFAILKPFSG